MYAVLMIDAENLLRAVRVLQAAHVVVYLDKDGPAEVKDVVHDEIRCTRMTGVHPALAARYGTQLSDVVTGEGLTDPYPPEWVFGPSPKKNPYGGPQEPTLEGLRTMLMQAYERIAKLEERHVQLEGKTDGTSSALLRRVAKLEDHEKLQLDILEKHHGRLNKLESDQ